jgi:hypothetical protein
MALAQGALTIEYKSYLDLPSSGTGLAVSGLDLASGGSNGEKNGNHRRRNR